MEIGSLDVPPWAVVIGMLAIAALVILLARARAALGERQSERDHDTGEAPEGSGTRNRDCAPASQAARSAAVQAEAGQVYRVATAIGEQAWLVLTPQRRLIGPHEDERIARRFLWAQRDIQAKYGIEVDERWQPPRIAVLRVDLSSPPFMVWEFKGSGPSLFGIKGPQGWVSMMHLSEQAAETLAASLAKKHAQVEPEAPSDTPKPTF